MPGPVDTWITSKDGSDNLRPAVGIGLRGPAETEEPRGHLSELDLLRNAEGVVDLDAEIANGAFELRMSEEELNGPKITGRSIDLRGLRPAH